MPERTTTKDSGLEEALAQKRAGRVIGPFTTAKEAMEFLYAFQRLLVLVEQALREAAKIGTRYDPKVIHWLLDVEDQALKRKLLAAKRSKT